MFFLWKKSKRSKILGGLGPLCGRETQVNFAFDIPPELVAEGSVASKIEQIISAISSMSSQFIPILVKAGVPSRMPEAVLFFLTRLI